MKLKNWIVTSLLAVALLVPGLARAGAGCDGKFPNFVTDICWSCMFPIKMGGNVTLMSGGQEDTPNPGDKLCWCPNRKGDLEVGVPVSFWEPSRIAEVVRRPYCFPTLGGITLDIDFGSQIHASTDKGWNHAAGSGVGFDGDKRRASGSRLVHWYISPIAIMLRLIMDSSCLDNAEFDLAYMDEVNPLVRDEILGNTFNPEAFLFSSLPMQALCAIDATVAAVPRDVSGVDPPSGYGCTAGFGCDAMIWCAGAHGHKHPLVSNEVDTWQGGVQASALLLNRRADLMGRMMLDWEGSGEEGFCTNYPQVIARKSRYKFTMIEQTTKIDGKCCQPLARTSMLWGAGKEIPMLREDFQYVMFKKRNCCEGVYRIK